MRWIDLGRGILVCRNGIPCLAIYIERMSGAHEALIADLTGFNMCMPFCEVGREISSMIC